MDERKILLRLAEIRELARPTRDAIKAIDALMQEMTFGQWPFADKPTKLIESSPAPDPPRKMEFFL